ncbi:MAG: molecular chaperone DnaK, partial [Thermodesulfobacteriota bacterium]|nr:molecular chaperone DnaK [Thermodesulfobacteriota bacterium]
TFTPQEISAIILRKIKSDAENYLGDHVEKAVITVPAYFNNRQRQATKEAGILAGLHVMRIINEPTAASLAYGLHREDIQTILIWDLGGGTFDVSILELGDGFFQVKAVCGDTRLGGDDWDERFTQYLADTFFSECGYDVRTDKMALQSLREVGEKAKRELSYRYKTGISLPLVRNDTGEITNLEVMINRETFDIITEDLRKKLLGPTRQALSDAGLNPGDIDRIVLVGGSTRMPAVRRMVEDVFHKRPYTQINPDEVVAIGAAVQAGILMREIEDVVLVDVTPLSLGIETQGGLFSKILPRNSTVPTSASKIVTTAEDNQTEMDIHILQGEREMVTDNISLGQFQLNDIPPMPRGKAQVEISFEIDIDGIVKVSAQDLFTENQMNITINDSHLLSDKEVEEMITDAESHAEDDMKGRDEVEIHILAERTIHAAQKAIEEKKSEMATPYLFDIQRNISELKKALVENESGLIRNKTVELRKWFETV